MPKDPDASKKLRECEKAVQKSKFEEAIALEWHSVAVTMDYRTIGMSWTLAGGPLCSALFCFARH